MIPYRTNRVHNRWTMWYHFGTGETGNDGVHDIDYTRWGLGVETHPSKVSAIGGKYLLRRRPGVSRHAASRRSSIPATASRAAGGC